MPTYTPNHEKTTFHTGREVGAQGQCNKENNLTRLDFCTQWLCLEDFFTKCTANTQNSKMNKKNLHYHVPNVFLLYECTFLHPS